MSTPSISVTNCGNAFNLASNLRQSYCVPQYSARPRIISSGTPREVSETVSRSGQRVAVILRRSSTISASSTFTLKGRIAVFSCATPDAGVLSMAVAPSATDVRRNDRRVDDAKSLHKLGSSATKWNHCLDIALLRQRADAVYCEAVTRC